MNTRTACVLTPRPPVCAVVVIYWPDMQFRERLMAIAAESDYVLVVDNGSPSQVSAELPRGIEWLQQKRNVGMAAALNIGLARARALGFDWAITFDQDSMPEAGMLAALWTTRCNQPIPAQVAIVGPRIYEACFPSDELLYVVPHPHCRVLFRRPHLEKGRDLAGVAFVISSGALLDLAILERIGPMDETLFIDCVDHDYCLRARHHGYEIAVSSTAFLAHNLGHKREYKFGNVKVLPTFHPPMRLRYMHRNRVRLWSRYALAFPYWAVFDVLFVIYNLLRLLLFEDRRRVKLLAVLLGLRDGLLRRSGPIELG